MSRTIARQAVTAWLRSFAAVVTAERDELTALDAAIGDADHGINMDRGMQAVVGKLPAGVDDGARSKAGDAQPNDLGTLFKTVGMTLVSTVGGAAGPLYGTFFLRMAGVAGERTELTLGEWATVFRAGVEGVQARGKAVLEDKTMIDALLPAAEALDAAVANGLELGDALRRAAGAAEQGMKATIPLVARKGRASYLGERSSGHQDPGATTSWLLLRTAAETLAGEAPERPAAGTGPAPQAPGPQPGT